MSNFNFDIEKSVNALLYISHKIGKTDFHKFFKTLYYAEQKHLAKYGTVITGDRYIAMKNGAVPSIIYNVFKEIRGGYIFIDGKILPAFKEKFSVQDTYYINGLFNPNMDMLSESEVECLDESIEENKNLGFRELSDKSHNGLAYKNARQDDIMSLHDIAIEGGAEGEMLKYIEFLRENNAPLTHVSNNSGFPS